MEKETRMMIIKPVLLSGLDANASNLSAREAGKLHTYKRASLAITRVENCLELIRVRSDYTRKKREVLSQHLMNSRE